MYKKLSTKLFIPAILISCFVLLAGHAQKAYAEIDSLDTAFNTVGYFVHNNAAGGNGYDYGRAVKIQGDGKIVIVGDSESLSNHDVALWRFNSNGTLDTTFNSTGYVTHDGAAGASGPEYGYGLAIQDDGKYVVVGSSTNSDADADMAIWRFNTDGSLDTTFNIVGYAVHDNAAGGNGYDMAYAVALQSDDKIVVVGSSASAGHADDMAIWRYNSDGTLDTTFSSNGYDTQDGTAGGTAYDAGSSVAIQGDGKIVVAGWSMNGTGGYDMVVWRYDTNGSLDTTFNTTGYIVHNNAGGGNGDDMGNAMVLQADGKIVVTGSSGSSGHADDMAIWRINTNGTLDTTFNSTGYVTHNGAAGGDNYDNGFGVSVQSDGKIIVTGNSRNASMNYDMVVWRYDDDGTLDTTFDGTGYMVHASAAGANDFDSGYAVAIQSDGKYVITGTSINTNPSPTYDMVVWRYALDYQVNISGITPESDGVNISTSTSDGDSGNDVLINLLRGTVSLADANVNIFHDLNWSDVIGDVDSTNYKSFISNLANGDGVDGALTLYVPYREGDDHVGICNSVTSLTDVNENCNGFTSREDGDTDTSIVTVDGVRYWRLTNMGDAGGFSFEEVLPDTGQGILLGVGVASLLLLVSSVSILDLKKKYR